MGGEAMPIKIYLKMIPSILSICTFSSEAPGKIHRQEVIHVIEYSLMFARGP